MLPKARPRYSQSNARPCRLPRELICLLGLLVVLSAALQPARIAWADDGKSDDGGDDSDGGSSSSQGNTGSERANDVSSGGSRNSSGHASSRTVSDDRDGTLATKLAGKIASLQEIETLAARLAPGEIVDVRLRRENGRVVYKLKIIQENDKLIVLRIDARTRTRLGKVAP